MEWLFKHLKSHSKQTSVETHDLAVAWLVWEIQSITLVVTPTRLIYGWVTNLNIIQLSKIYMFNQKIRSSNLAWTVPLITCHCRPCRSGDWSFSRGWHGKIRKGCGGQYGAWVPLKQQQKKKKKIPQHAHCSSWSGIVHHILKTVPRS